MITVIADDFTGAAELGGIGLRYGLDVEICRSVPQSTQTDILIIATNTRIMDEEEATKTIDGILSQLNDVDVTNFFKKTDSVLRGHVIAELEAVQQHLGNQNVLLVPSNPSLNRTISDEIYYVEGQPVHETSFANEYQKKPSSSHILELLNTDKKDISILRIDQPFISCPFVVGEAQTVAQVESWAHNGAADRRILGGGADFFAAFLKSRGYSQKHLSSPGPNFSGSTSKWLLVCGSASEFSGDYVARAWQQGEAVCVMPEVLFESIGAGNGIDEALVEQWADDIKRAVDDNYRVIVAIQKPLINDEEVSQKLSTCLAYVTTKVLRNTELRELFIEGGSTAAAIIQRLEFDFFLPVQELAPGVIRMQVAEHPKLYLTLKPGSYSWP